MDTHTTDRTPPKARTVRPDCCADEKCTSGSRNNASSGPIPKMSLSRA